MLRGYRLYIVALGLVLAGASTPPKHQGQDKAAAAESQPSPANSSPINGGQPPDYQKPCDGQERNRNSDLCAQWTAADAARNAADWSYIGLWLTGVSIIGLFVTLGFNYAAWDQARKSKGATIRALDAADKSADAAAALAEAADKNARKELRAYLDFNGVTLKRWPEYLVKPGEIGMRHRIKLKNYGKTPAENVHITSTFTMHGRATKQAGPLFEADPEEKPLAVVSPGASVHEQSFFGFTEELMTALSIQLLVIKVYVIVTYTDVFGDRHLLRSEYQTTGSAESMGFIPGTRVSN